MYKSLQGGRAVAAMLVVLYHLGIAIAADKYFGIAAFAVPFSFGSAGVEFFFVLSGFIILAAHRDDIFQPGRLAGYLKRRVIRIYPTYWMIFLSVYFLGLASSAWRNTVPHDAWVVLKSLLLIPQDRSIVGGTGAPVINVAWTLQYEMLFYLFFGFLILSRWLSMIAGAALLFVYVKYSGASPPSFLLSFLAQDYILLFGMGMAVSVACKSRNAILNRPAFVAGLGAAAFLVIALDTVMASNQLIRWQTILYGLASSMVVFGLVQAEDRGQVILGHKWMQLLGDSSYALYLIHYPLISILCKLSQLLQLDKLGIVGAAISYVTIFGACLFSAAVFHLKVEKPVTAYLRNRP